MKAKEKDTLGIKHPHDHFIRKILSAKENIQSFLQHYLPPELVEIIDPDSVQTVKTSFIDANLRTRQSDLLFHLTLRERPAYLYLLFEHKRDPEEMTALQLLKYKVRIWEREVKMHPGLRNLTPVIGYVFYHGDRDWKRGTSFQELWGEVDERLQKYLVNFEYILQNVRLLPDEEIKGNPEVGTTVYMMKHIFDRDLPQALRKLLERYKTVFTRREFEDYVVSFFVYLYSVRSVKPEEIKQLFEEKDMLDPVTHEKTTVEVLIEQGEKRGRTKGIREGIREGIQEEKQSVLTHQLTRKFGLEESEKAVIRKTADLKKLDQALDRILFTENKKDVLDLLR